MILPLLLTLFLAAATVACGDSGSTRTARPPAATAAAGRPAQALNPPGGPTGSGACTDNPDEDLPLCQSGGGANGAGAAAGPEH